jgi:dTDP-4-dehydrorhamnose reductase
MNSDLVVVLGSGGMLGSDLVPCLQEMNVHVAPLYSSDLDITDEARVYKLIADCRPSTVINCAAYTNVANAETETERSNLVNGTALKYLAGATHKYNARLIHFSTDYVFDGFKGMPYVESDNALPLNIYGKSKLHGEKLCMGGNRNSVIFRLQWLWGKHGVSFIRKIAHNIDSHGEAGVVSDQFGCPTSTLTVSKIVLECLKLKDMRGIFHVSHDDHASWYDFAVEALSLIRFPSGVVKPTSTISGAVIRPMDTRLSNEKLKKALGVNSLGEWRIAMKEYLEKFRSFY